MGPRFDDLPVGCFHDIFTENLDQQMTELSKAAARSKPAMLAYCLALDDATVRRNHSGERDVVHAALDRYVSDISPKGLRFATKMAGDHMHRPCDPEIVPALLSRGINPIAMMQFELMLRDHTTINEHTVSDDEGRQGFLCLLKSYARRGIEHDYAMLQIGEDTWWNGQTLSITRGILPETVLAMIIGQTVGKVVDHPLVPTDAVVTEITQSSKIIMLRTDRIAPVATWRQALQSAMEA